VLVVLGLCGAAFSAAPVNYAATVPGPDGEAIAFLAELAISTGMMWTILTLSGSPRTAPFTGIAAGVLVASYISFEGPLSGMSMNPARTFASAAPASMWQHLWIYFAAPVTGMLVGAFLHRMARQRTGCAKLVHSPDVRCIHCGYEPNRGESIASTAPRSLTS
jgi:aquaporin Z